MAGRPRANIDWKKVDTYLQAHCEGTGIAGLLGIHPNTLYEECKRLHKCNFSDYQSKKRAEGKDLLRGKQMQLAMSGDKTMLIWLGKQYLNQTERQAITHDINAAEEISKFFPFKKRNESQE